MSKKAASAGRSGNIGMGIRPLRAPQSLEEMSLLLHDFNSYPILDIMLYSLSTCIIREDGHDSITIMRKRPFASWLSVILMCHSPEIVRSVLLSEPLIECFKNTQKMTLVTCVWLAVIYSPCDVVHKFLYMRATRLVLIAAREFIRIRVLEDCIKYSYVKYQKEYGPAIVLGVLCANSTGFFLQIARFLMGRTVNAMSFISPTILMKLSIAFGFLTLMTLEKKLPSYITDHKIYAIAYMVFFFFHSISTMGICVDPFFMVDVIFEYLVKIAENCNTGGMSMCVDTNEKIYHNLEPAVKQNGQACRSKKKNM